MIRLARITAALFLANIASAQVEGLPDYITIKNVTVISAHLEQPQPGMDVRIEDGRIAEVVATGTGTPTAEVIDGTGRYLIPGLIDSHVHLGHNPVVARKHGAERLELLAAYQTQQPRSYLYHGVTSVVDLDFNPDRSKWPEDAALAPQIYHCGRGVRVAGGYGPVFVPADIAHRVFPNLVYQDHTEADWPEALDPEAYSAEAAVARVVGAGAICLKTYVETGFGGVFNWPSPDAQTLADLTRHAHDAGLPVVVHANSAGAWTAAVEAGADIIGHGMWHWSGNRSDASLTPSALEAVALAASSGIALQPTLGVLEGERKTLIWDLSDMDRIAQVLPNELKAYLVSPESRWSQIEIANLYERHNPDIGTMPRTLIETSIARATNSMLAYFGAGGTLVLGTDTPAQDGIGNLPGLNTLLEIEGWARAGIPLETIFEAATLGNARAFNLQDEIGSVRGGVQADLLLLGSNPLQNVAAYDDIDIVFVDGVPIGRSQLSAQ